MQADTLMNNKLIIHNHRHAFAHILYIMYEQRSDLSHTTCLRMIVLVGSKCSSKCKCLHKWG